MFGEKLRALRKENKISQEELAEKLEVSRQSISLWENDQTQPSMEKIVHIANIFGVSTDVLLLNGVSKAEEKTPKSSSKKLKVWEIAALGLGSPVWVSLCVVAAAVLISVYAFLWAVIISLWAVFASFAACSIGGVLACVVFTVGGNGASGLAMLAAGIVCAGLSIFMLYGCKAATKGNLILSRNFVVWIKNCFIKKEVA